MRCRAIAERIDDTLYLAESRRALAVVRFHLGHIDDALALTRPSHVYIDGVRLR